MFGNCCVLLNYEVTCHSYSFCFSSDFQNVNDIDDYCDIINGNDQTSRFIHSILHADVELLDAAFDSNGNILHSILELLDVNIYGAVELFDLTFTGSNILTIKHQINAVITVVTEIVQNTVYLILGDADWLNGLNINGQLCTRLNCRRRIIF